MARMFGFLRRKKPSPNVPAEDRCAFCGRKLSADDTYRFKGKRCCPDCYREKHPEEFCCRCGREGPLYIWDRKKYCSACYRFLTSVRVCAFCGKQLQAHEPVCQKRLSTDGGAMICHFCADCGKLLDERGITGVVHMMMQPEYKEHYQRHKRDLPWWQRLYRCHYCRCTLTDTVCLVLNEKDGRTRITACCPACRDEKPEGLKGILYTFRLRDGITDIPKAEK